MDSDPMPHRLVDHFFRHESGRLVACLVRFFGLRHFDLVEDMVQSALVEAAIPLTLKSLCGFNEQEIARGMLLEPEAVRKRIYRTRQMLVEQRVSLELPSARQLPARLYSVHNVLYLIFNEGYLSTNNDQAIRSDVCEEAARLCHLLTEHPNCSTRTTFALLALMLFHASRFDSRIDGQGGLVLLEDQDRCKWDQRMMSRAMDYLNQASAGESTSVYHFEAAIAMHHCRAKTFAETNWSAIIRLYDRLIMLHGTVLDLTSGYRPWPVLRKRLSITRRCTPCFPQPICKLESKCLDCLPMSTPMDCWNIPSSIPIAL